LVKARIASDAGIPETSLPGYLDFPRLCISSTGCRRGATTGELRRQLVWAETPARLFHFRDRDGLEVDIVVESNARRVAGIELKAAGSVSQGDFKGLAFLREKLGNRFAMGVVLYTGKKPLPFGDRLWALPYSALWE
jgi:predicted AAA+ superfamily ATPase